MRCSKDIQLSVEVRGSRWYHTVSGGERDVPDGILLTVEVSEMFKRYPTVSGGEMFQMVSHCQWR